MDTHYCWLCLGVDCFGGRFSLSSGSLPDDLHLELSSEGLSKGHMGPLLLRQVWVFFGLMRVIRLRTRSHSACVALRGFGSK